VRKVSFTFIKALTGAVVVHSYIYSTFSNLDKLKQFYSIYHIIKQVLEKNLYISV